MAGLGLGGARTAVERLYPHPPHQRFDMPAADLAPLGSQQASQHSRTGERKLQMQPVEPSHDREVVGRHRPRQIIDAAAADVQSFRLSGDWQIVRTVNHRFALSRPALLSAPSKKLSWRCAPPVGVKRSVLACARKGAAVTILVACTPSKNLVHGLLRA